MALPPIRYNPTNPIPNNPFYSPESFSLQGTIGPIVVGSGLNINYATNTISSSGGGGAVSQVTGGTGISVSPTTGNVVVTNTGVTSLVPGSGITLSGSTGAVTISSSGGGGTITNIATGTGLTGGPITTSGTISLANTSVTPGVYANGSFTVDAQGRLTAASANPAPVTSVTGTAPIAVTAGTTPVVSIAASSTTSSGAVQLYDDVNSTSTSLALTAAQGKALQDQINLLLTTPGIELAGTINASTGLVESVTSVGTTAGYTVGSALPTAVVANVNTYVIVTTPGTLTPPGGSPTAATRGDWFLSSEVSIGVYAWQFLNVGFDAPAATTSVQGIVCLSTNALAQAGTDTTTALTPAAAASAYIPNSCVTAKGTLITGTAACTPTGLPVGTNGQVLVACSTATTGLCWQTIGAVPATPTTFGTVLGCTTAGIAALGCNALGSNAFGALCGHVAIGLCALYSTNSTSYNNIAIGGCSQALTTSGNSNVAIGFCSLALNTTGSGNVAIGDRALSKNTTSGTNTAVGWLALGCFTGTSVSTNDAFGANALPSFICGDYNVSIGGWSLFNAICGTLNTAVGHRALTGVTCANINTALGFYAGQNITTGCSNVAIGSCTHVANPAGSCQLVIGWAPSCNWLTGDSNKNIRPGNGIIDCIGSVGTACQVLRTTGTGALQWSSLGAMSSGFVNDVGTVGQWIEIDGIQFGMWTGCRSFVMRPASGTMTASWGTCYQGGVVGFAATNFQDIAIASPNWRFLYLNANFPSHATVQQATICVAASGGFTRAMYQFCGIVGASYLGNGISVTRIA